MKKIRVKLTEDGLWINKYKCKNATITQTETGFSVRFCDIEGITQRKPLFWKGFSRKKTVEDTGKPVINCWTKKQEIKITGGVKTINAATMFYEGIPLCDNGLDVPKTHLYYDVSNSQGNYVNFYYLKNK